MDWREAKLKEEQPVSENFIVIPMGNDSLLGQSEGHSNTKEQLDLKGIWVTELIDELDNWM